MEGLRAVTATRRITDENRQSAMLKSAHRQNSNLSLLRTKRSPFLQYPSPQKPHFSLASIDAIQYFPDNCKNRQPNLNRAAILPDPETKAQEKWNLFSPLHAWKACAMVNWG